MIEVGSVTKVKGKRAEVKVEKKDECSKCGMCLFPKNASSINFNANNDIGAKEGDLVKMEMSEKSKLVGALLVFLVPLILIGISAVITYVFIKKEIYLIAISLPLVVIWFVILAFIDKKIAGTKNFSPTIVQIIAQKTNEIKEEQKEEIKL
ncbi:MAG: SoxR reducing system RseC family protein [Clostridia bacterium]|nr:SoxR reducing system RseC family protein [Clostridia bacterium]